MVLWSRVRARVGAPNYSALAPSHCGERVKLDGPARLVFEAWTRPELLKQWWVPKSMGMSPLSLDAAGSGAADATVETFAQLDELLVTLGARS